MTDLAHAAFAQEIQKRRSAGPVTVPHMVNGKAYYDGKKIQRHDPSNPAIEVSACHDAPAELVLKAVEASRRAQLEWEAVPLKERVSRIRAGIKYVEEHVEDWAIRAALEIGKPYAHARAEALETIQFLKIYPDYAEEPGAFVDERWASKSTAAWRSSDEITNHSVLRPYGVFGVITPFNYPICLAAGPAIAALLAGNGVVIKTSHLGPWSGHAVYEMFEAMNIPVGLVNVIHGGDEPGKALVASTVDGISFVGSAEAGLSIMREISAGQYPRPLIAEMGGKNPVIVTDTADVEAAAEGIVYSAFDLGGQKCSALSRVLVTPGVHDALVQRVSELSHSLHIAGPTDINSVIGPVINEQSFEKYFNIVEAAKKDNLHISGGSRVGSTGLFVNPLVISGLPEYHDLARNEHFLPVVTISQVSSFEEAMKAANAVPYGLTAGIFTGNKEEAREFVRRIEAGCINVNVPGHATTGWWPGPQTFGGWKASGSTGKQAFGKWYVQQFAREQAQKIPKDLEDFINS